MELPRRIVRFFATISLVAAYFLLTSTSVNAACNPPQDYSSCPITTVGPKIAANTDPQNYQQIREQYNQYNPSLANQQIPVTVIYTTADLSPANLQRTTSNLQAMQQYGLQPIIRISSSVIGAQGWDRITTAEAQTAAQALNAALSQVHFSQRPTVYFGNEPNLPSEWGGEADALSFAESFAAFIQAAGPGRSFQLFVPPVATHQGGVEYSFMQQILNFRLPNGRTIAESVDGAALTIYNNNSQTLSALYQDLTRFYQQNGVGRFVISEIGPLIEGRLLQNPGDVQSWASIMSQVFRDIQANPALFAGAQVISTSFFLDTDEPPDGFPDVTLLVVIDANGNVIIMELTTLGGGILTSPTYGECQADQPFIGGVMAKGKSFDITIHECFWESGSAERYVDKIIKAFSDMEFPDNQTVANYLYGNVLPKLTPPGYTPNVQSRSTLGKVTFEVCDPSNNEWFTVEKELEFKTSGWVEKMKTTGRELYQMLVWSGGGTTSTLAGRRSVEEEGGGGNTTVLAQAENPSFRVSIRSVECRAVSWQVSCTVVVDTVGGGHLWVHANDRMIGFNAIEGEMWGHTYTYPPPGDPPLTIPPGASSFTVNVHAINHDLQPKPEDSATCVVPLNSAGNGSCNTGGGGTPLARACKPHSPDGGDIPSQLICFMGYCYVKDVPKNPFSTFIDEITGAITSLCPSRTLRIIPYTFTPHVDTIDFYLREKVFASFAPPTKELPRVHALEDMKVEASPEETTEVEIYGQKGVKDAYDWLRQALTPPVP